MDIAVTESVTSKTCTKCGEVKALDEFHRMGCDRDGRARRCRACMAPARTREEVAAYNAQYYAANQEKCKATCARWREANPGWWRASVANYRARKQNAPGRGVTPAQHQEVLESTGGLCAYCGKKRRLTVDHIVPLAEGGAHDVDNLAPACLSCNSSKSAKPLDEWHRARDLPLLLWQMVA